MKKIVTILLMSASITSALSADWYIHWRKAMEYKNEKKYEKSLTEFGKAIKYVEVDLEEKHMHTYTDRASVYCIQKRWYDALVDLNIALDAPTLTKNERIKALKYRIKVYRKINMGYRAEEDEIELESY